VLPVELRRTMGLDLKDTIEIYIDGDNIFLKKYNPSCIICGKVKNITYFRDKIVCQDCIDEIKQ